MTVTVGSITDTPAAGDPIRSAWAQDVTGQTVHVFATKAALDAATAGWTGLAAGAHAYSTGDTKGWVRVGTDWVQAYELGDWDTYTPTFSGTIGNGTLSGAWTRVGRTVNFYARVDWGSTTSHTAGSQLLGLPVASQTLPTHISGSVQINQSGTARWYHPYWQSTTTVGGVAEAGARLTDVLPVTTWATGHYWEVTGMYRAAASV